MISRDRVIRTLNHQPIDRAPRDLWLMPGMEAGWPDDVAEIDMRFPNDVLHFESKWPSVKRGKAHCQTVDSPALNSYTDAWGCVWQVGEHSGLAGLVSSPLAGALAVATYEPPPELLDSARFTKVNPLCEGTGRFTLANSDVRPLDRLRQLRGPETTVVELCEGNRDLSILLDKLHAFFRKEVDLWAKTQVDGVVLGDDLAWVAASPKNLKIWRTLFKPLLREYCDVLHRRDKFVFFLSEGTSGEALDDLVELGVDAVHAQWPREELEKHVARHRGKVTFWGGVERRRVEPPCQCNDIREAVLRARKSLDFGAGGVISQIAWGSHVPLQSIATFFEQWLIPLPVTI